jgi:GT2 family glycosyltransferase
MSTNRIAAISNEKAVAVVDPLVSILIPCCGMLEYTKLCVPSILRYSRRPIELIFIDIGSLDGTAEYLAGLAAGVAPLRVEAVRTATDLGISDACKEALGRAKGQYLVLLNNDTVVTHCWLDQMIALVSHSVDIGMVGPMSNSAAVPQLVETVPYRVGPRKVPRFQAAMGDGPILVDVSAIDNFAHDFREKNRGNYIHVERLGGFCLLLKREVLLRIGFALDAWADLGLFDTDVLSMKARQAGFNLAICRDLFVHHFGTRTFAQGAPVVAGDKVTR